jgi:hypothetical protein
MQNDFIKNKRQRIENETIGYQGEDGSKITEDKE